MAGKFSLPGARKRKSSNSSFDLRSLKKYTSPQATDDLNRFLEKMPTNVGQTMLAVAAVSWMAAGAVGLYTTVQLQQISEFKAELEEASSLVPQVPTLQNRPVRADELKNFAETMSNTYRGLKISASGDKVTINAPNTANFGEWREAISHLHNGGMGWKIKTEKLCVGRECGREPLSATLKVNKVDVIEAIRE